MLCISCKIVDVDTSKIVKSSTGVDAFKVIYPDGYISSVPIDVFKRSYIPINQGDLDLIHDVINKLKTH